MKSRSLSGHHIMSLQLAILLALAAMQIRAQDCVDTIASTTNISHYRINKDGTVYDKKHDVEWMRCSIGQTWRNGSCLGEAELVTWEKASNAANTSRFAGHSSWRIPTIYELSRITELRCQQPAINLELFPNTLSGDYWTADTFVNDAAMAWQVHFMYGENHTVKKSTRAAVRLIRSVQR